MRYFFSVFKGLWRIITLDRFRPQNLSHHAQLTYQVALFSFYLTLQYPVLFRLLGLPVSSLSSIPFALLFLTSLILNHKEYYTAAKYTLFFCGLSCLIFFSLLLGRDSGASLILFGLAVFPGLLFSSKERNTINVLTNLPLLGFILIYLIPQDLLPFSERLSERAREITFLSGGVTAFVYINFQTSVYRKTKEKFQSFLEKSNTDLKDTNLKLEVALQNSEKQQKLLEDAKRVMDKEIELAQQIQLPLMPESPPALENLDIQVFYRPCRQIGGDYYDFIPYGKRQVMGIIADMTGKGIPASLMTTYFRALVHKLWRSDMPLDAFLGILNNKCIHNKFIQKAVCCTVWKMDLTKKTMQYASAGMDPGYLIQSQGVKALEDVGGIPLGMFEDAQYTSHKIRLEKNDKILFFTDGIFDQKNLSGEQLSIERFEQFLRQNNTMPSSVISESLLDVLETHSNGEKQTDDMTMLLLANL